MREDTCVTERFHELVLIYEAFVLDVSELFHSSFVLKDVHFV